MLSDDQDKLRQQFLDTMIREMNAEIDEDTIRRFRRGERIANTGRGYEWVYVVDQNNMQVTDPDVLRQLLGYPMP